MTNEDLLAEIRELRQDIKELKKEFYIFKGKAFSFISILSVGINYLIQFITNKGH